MKLAPPRPTPRRPGPTGPAPSLQLALEPRLLLSADLVALALSAVPDAVDGTPDDALEVLMAAGDSSVAETQPAPATPTGAPGDRRSARAASQSGSVLVFAGQGVDANGEPVGRELLYTDGTETGLLKDIYPGARSGYPTDFFQLQDGRVLFVANDGLHGREVWVTDGTGAGTQRVGAIHTDSDLDAVHIGIVGGPAGGVLSYTPAVSGGRIQARWDSVGQVLTLSGGGSVAEYLTALGEVTFSRGGSRGHGLSSGDTVQVVVAAGPDLDVHFDTQQRPRFMDIVVGHQISALRVRDEMFWSERYGLAARLSPVPTAHELGLAKALMSRSGRGVSAAWIGLDRLGSDWLLDWDGDRQGEYTANTLLSGIAKGGDLSNEAGPYGVLEKSGGSYQIYGASEHDTHPTGYLVEYTPRAGEAYGTLFEFSHDGSNIMFTRQALTMGAAAGAKSPAANAALSSGGKLQVFSGDAASLMLRPEGRRPFRDIGDSLATGFIEFTDSKAKQRVLLAANDGVHGVELWQLDPADNSLTLLKDLNTDKSKTWNPLGNAHPEGFAVLGDKVLFTALDGTHGRELWITDGTEAGTQLVKDIRTGSRTLDGQSLPRDSEPTGLTVFRSAAGLRAVFAAQGSSGGRQLWITDGTDAGTTLLKTLRSRGNAEPAEFVVVPGTATDTVFFVAYDGTHGRELWVSDGTGGGTQVLDVMLSGNGSSRPAALTVYGEYVFFTATASGSVGRELWVSDGTSSGTVRVTNIDTRTGATERRLNQGPQDVFIFGGLLLFAAEDDSTGYEPYALDVSPLSSGTAVTAFAAAAAPVRLADVRTGNHKGSFPRLFSEFDGKVYFSADDGGTHGRELWVTDGTAAGTERAQDVNPGRAGSSPTGLQVATHKAVTGNTVTAAAADEAAIVAVQDGLDTATALVARLRVLAAPTTGVELFIADQAGQVALLKDIRLGRDGSYPRGLVPLVNGQVLFSADDGWRGRELWVTDGTAAGTRLWKDLRPGALSSAPYLLQVLDGTVHFVADDGVHGFELWQIDKASGKALRLTDIEAGAAHTAIQALAWHQGKVVLQVEDQWYELDSQGAPQAITPDPVIAAGDNAPFALTSYTPSADMTQYFRTLRVVSSVSAGHVYDLSGARIVIEAAAADTYGRWSLRALARTLSEDLQDRFGVVVPVAYTALKRPGDIVLGVDGDALAGVSTGGQDGDEAYRLVLGEQVTVSGLSPRAVFHGTRTLLKLLGLAGGVQADGQVSLPAVDIKDWPRVGWRGMMLDTGRKYMQPDFVEQQLRQASWLGLNVFHMHVSEWNAFRLNSQQFPGLGQLRDVPGGRKYAPYRDTDDRRFYDRVEIERLHDIARRYFVDLVFELDMPGHTTVLTEYDPHLELTDVTGHTWQPHSFNITTPYGQRWVANLLNELMPHFDSAYYHIGGDEVFVGGAPHALTRYATVLGYPSTDRQSANLVWIETTAARLSADYGKRSIIWGNIEEDGDAALSRDIIIEWWKTSAVEAGYDLIYARDGGDDNLYYTPARGGGPLLDEAGTYTDRIPEYSNTRLLGYQTSQWSDFGEDQADGWLQSGMVGGLRNDNREGLKMALPAAAAAFWNGSGSRNDQVQGGWSRYQALLDALGRAPGLFSLDVSTDDAVRLTGADGEAFFYEVAAGKAVLIDAAQTLAYVGGTRVQLAGVTLRVSFGTALPGDRLGLAAGSGFQVQGSKVQYFGRTVGTVLTAQDGVGRELGVRLNYRAGRAVLDALLRSVVYAYEHPDSSPLPVNLFGRTVTLRVAGRPRGYDGALDRSVTVRQTRGVRALPVVSVHSGQTHTFSADDFGSPQQLRIGPLPLKGRLLLDGQAVAVNTVVAAADLGKLQYVSGANPAGVDGFHFAVWDGTAWSLLRELAILRVNAVATGTVVITGTGARGVDGGHERDNGCGRAADPLVYSYAWQRSTDAGNSWTAIDNATGTTYTLVPADAGHTLRVVVSFTMRRATRP